MKPRQATTLSMHFTMHAEMGGPHEFQVPLMTNDPLRPARVFTVRSSWGP